MIALPFSTEHLDVRRNESRRSASHPSLRLCFDRHVSVALPHIHLHTGHCVCGTLSWLVLDQSSVGAYFRA